MSTFSAVDSALSGFSLVRKSPMLILAWTGLYLVAMVLVGALVFLLAGGSILSMAAMGDDPDPAAVMAAMSGIWLVLLLAIPVFMIISAMFTAAVYRAILRPDERKLAYVTLGADEWRMILVGIIYFIIGAIVAAVIVGLFVGVAAVVGEAARGLVLFLLGLAALCLWIFLGVRISLAWVQTFAERRLNLFGTWSLTGGRFWPMFGMWLLAFVFAILVAIGATILSYIPLLAFGGMAALAQTASPDFAAMSGGIIVGLILYGLIQLVGSIIQSVVLYAPAATAYRQLTGDQATPEVFS